MVRPCCCTLPRQATRWTIREAIRSVGAQPSARRVRLTQRDVEALSDPVRGSATQAAPPWGLDRVDQRGPVTDRGDHVREEAAAALGQLGDSRAVTPLTQARSDRHVMVRRAAEIALRRLNPDASGGLQLP